MSKIDNFFVFKMIKLDRSGYHYGIYNKDHDKWCVNIVFTGTEQECIDYKNNLLCKKL